MKGDILEEGGGSCRWGKEGGGEER